MKTFIRGALTTAFTAAAILTAAPQQTQATPQPSQRADIENLQIKYDALKRNDPNDILTQVIFVPRALDKPTFAAYGIAKDNAYGDVARFMANAVKDRYGTKPAFHEIQSRVLSFGGREMIDLAHTYSPRQILALVRDANGHEHTTCFAAMPEPIKDVEKELQALVGMQGYVGNNGEYYDGSNADNPYTYHMDIPLSQEAWTSFKTHYAAASCLLNRNNPQVEAMMKDRRGAHIIRNLGFAFAAIMAARDGYPEILDVLPDYMAAVTHNLGGYPMDYNYAQLLEPTAMGQNGLQGSTMLEGGQGGFQISYPIPVLDELNAQWKARPGDLKAQPVAYIFALALEETQRLTPDDKQFMALLADIIMPYDPVPDDMVDKQYEQLMLERAEIGGKRLNNCVTPSESWQKRIDKNTGKSYWDGRNRKIWTPPLCP